MSEARFEELMEAMSEARYAYENYSQALKAYQDATSGKAASLYVRTDSGAVDVPMPAEDVVGCLERAVVERACLLTVWLQRVAQLSGELHAMAARELKEHTETPQEPRFPAPPPPAAHSGERVVRSIGVPFSGVPAGAPEKQLVSVPDQAVPGAVVSAPPQTPSEHRADAASGVFRFKTTQP